MAIKLLNHDFGLLILRLGLGGMMLTHGIPKLMKGPGLWPKIGSTIEVVGIDFGHSIFGAAAVGAETLGALLVILGFKTRPAALSVVLTMAVAALMHQGSGDSWSKISHPIEVGIAFLAICIAGSGKYGIDKG
jgi:putative oxidoreductase